MLKLKRLAFRCAKTISKRYNIEMLEDWFTSWPLLPKITIDNLLESHNWFLRKIWKLLSITDNYLEQKNVLRRSLLEILNTSIFKTLFVLTM